MFICKSFSSYFIFKDCPPGYLWVNCGKKCEYPAFGKRCALKCTCEKHLCHFQLGCVECKYIFFHYNIIYVDH